MSDFLENNTDFDFEEQQDLFEHYRFEVDKGQSLLRIDKYLINLMSNVSRNRVQEAASAGTILVNDRVVKSNYRVKPLDKISIMLTYPPGETEIIPQNIPIDIAHEDEDILLINKHPGLVVHPGFGNFKGTLLNAVAWHWKDNEGFDPNDGRLGLVHRIDKDTSGLILVAKTAYAKSFLSAQFQNKTTYRRYQALVWGTVKEDEGTIEGAVMRDPRDKMSFGVFDQEEYPQAKHAVTHYKVLERFAYTTLVECRLETGRTHQIRVHMKHIGHTLFNDERYGGNEVLKGVNNGSYKQFIKNCFDTCPRQALHAKTLGFVHPRTQREMFFDSELPEDMQNLIEKWRNYKPAE